VGDETGGFSRRDWDLVASIGRGPSVGQVDCKKQNARRVLPAGAILHSWNFPICRRSTVVKQHWRLNRNTASGTLSELRPGAPPLPRSAASSAMRRPRAWWF